MTTQIDTALELDDIQAAALMPRPNPYAGTYVAVRIDDRQAGRELLRRLIPLLDPVATFDPGRPVSLGVGLSYSGLEALGVPEQSLASFPAEFRQGMAARADYIGDVGENAPEHWEAPLGSTDVHLVVAALARDTSLMENLVTLAQDAIRDLPGIAPIWALDVHVPADGREQFGFKDSISQPAVEGTNILGSNRHEAPLKAGEFVLGYEDENGDHLRQPVARRHHRHALHRADRWPRRTTDQRRRRPADLPQLSLPGSRNPDPPDRMTVFAALAPPSEEAPSSTS